MAERETKRELLGPVTLSVLDRLLDDDPKSKTEGPLTHSKSLAQLKVAKAIPNQKFGLSQFQIGQPEWEKYLKGEESDPKKAMKAAWDAVQAEAKKSA